MAFNNITNKHLKKTIEEKKRETPAPVSTGNTALDKRIEDVAKIENNNLQKSQNAMRKLAETKVASATAPIVAPAAVPKAESRDAYDSRVRKSYAERNRDTIIQSRASYLADKYSYDELKKRMEGASTKSGDIYGRFKKGVTEEEYLYGQRKANEEVSAYKSAMDIIKKRQEEIAPNIQRVTDRDGYDIRVRKGNAKNKGEILQDAWDKIKDPYTREELKKITGEIDSMRNIQSVVELYKKDIQHEKDLMRRKNNFQSRARGLSTGTAPTEEGRKRAEENLKKYLNSKGFENELELERAIGEKEEQRKRLRWLRKGVSMSTVADPSSNNYDKDFEEKSTFISPIKDRNKPTLKEMFSYTEDKKIYDYINNVDMSREYATAMMLADDSGYDILRAGYEYITEKEKKLYNYYYNQYGPEKGREYLNTIMEELGRRKAEKDFEGYQGNTAKELFTMADAGLDRFREGLKNYFNSKDEYIPVNATQQMSGMIREDLPEWASVVYDLGTTTFNMAPSILASATLNMIAPGTGLAPLAGTGMMGVSAAGNAYQEKLNQGYTKEQARVYGTGIGIAEASMQYFLGGISKLGGRISGKTVASIATGIDNAIGRFAVKYGVNVASEGLEEALQEIISPYMENLALGYMKNDVTDINWEEVAYSGLLGALSAGLLEGVPIAVDTVGENMDAKVFGNMAKENGTMGDIIDNALKSPKGSEAQILAEKYADKGVNADNITPFQAGRLYVNMQRAADRGISSDDISVAEEESDSNAKNKKGDIKKSEKGTSLSTEDVETKIESTFLERTDTDIGKDILHTNDGDVSHIAEAALASDNDELRDNGLLVARQIKNGRVSPKDAGKLARAMYKNGYSPFTGDKLEVSEGTASQSSASAVPGVQEGETALTEGTSSASADGTDENVQNLANDEESSVGTVDVNAVKAGIVADSVSAKFGVDNPEEYRAINKMSKDLKKRVIFEELDDDDGYYDSRSGELHINIYAESPMNVIKKHESTHILEDGAKYGELITFAKENMSKEWSEKENKVIDLYRKVNEKRTAKNQESIELTPERLEREVMAELAEDFVSDKTLDIISREKPSLMKKAVDFIREIVSKLRNVILPKELSVYEQAEQKWIEAYNDAKENGTVGGEEVGYKLSESARKEVRKALYNKNYIREVKLTDESPSIIVSQKGVRNLPMVMNPSHIRENIFTEEQAKKQGLKIHPDINYHGLGVNLFLDVIDGLGEVKEAYRGTKYAEKPERRENYFLLISQYVDKDGNIINVPVYVNEKGSYNRVFVDVNKIATVFGRKELRKYINEQIEKGNLVRIKNRNIRTSESTSPINAHYETNASTGSIYQIGQKSQEKTEMDTKKHKLQDPYAERESFAEYIVRVETENKALKDANAKLKDMVGVKEDFSLNPARINDIATKIKAEYKSKMPVRDIAARMQEVAERYWEEQKSAGGDISQESFDKFMYEFAKIGEEIAEASDSFKDTTLYDTYKSLIDRLRTTAISISDEDARSIPDYKAFRKSMFGKLRISKNADISVDSFYEALLSEYPGMFDATITHPADRLMEIANVRRSLMPKVNELEVEQAGLCIAVDSMNQIFSNTAEDDQTIVEAVKSGFMAEYREERKAREDRLKLLTIARRIKKLRTTPEILEKIPAILEEIDTVSVSLLDRGFIRKSDGVEVMGKLELEGLKERYNQEKESQDKVFVPNRYIEEKIERLEKMQISDMRIEDVRDLIEVLMGIETEARNAKKLLVDGQRKDAYKAGEACIKEFRSGKGIKEKNAVHFHKNYYDTRVLSPERQARRMTGYKKDSMFVKLINGLKEGERKALAFTQKAEQTFSELLEDKENMKKLSSEKVGIAVKVQGEDGVKVKKLFITPAMRIALYLQSKDYDNVRHMESGGILIPDFDMYKKGEFERAYGESGKDGKGYIQGQRVRLTKKQIDEICAGMTEFEKKFAECTDKWLNGDCKNKLNQTSLALLGYEVARKKQYFPIKTDKNFTQTNFAVIDGTLEGSGNLKERQKGASNPIYLVDVLRVIEQQKRLVGNYYGLAIPLRNFKLLWNVQLSGYSDSVKSAATNTWGKAGFEYFEQLILNLEGGRTAGSKTAAMLRGNYASAVLGLNVKTVLKQFSGYPLGASVLGTDAIMKGGRITAEDRERMNKYSPLIWHRMQGYMMAETGDYIAAQDTFDKKHPKLMGWLQRADTVVCEKFWKASEYRVNQEIEDGNLQIEKGTDAYWKKVAELFNRAVEETQSSATIMTRPDLLRNSGDIMKSTFLMFKGQPMQMYGMAYDAVGEYIASRESGNKEWKKEAGMKLRRTMGSIVASAVLEAGIGCVVDWVIFRTDRDDEEKAEDKIIKVINEAVGGIIGLAPGADVVWDVLNKLLYEADVPFFQDSWYDMDELTTSTVNDGVSRIVNIVTMLADEDRRSDYREYIKIMDNVVNSVGRAFGSPIGNVKKFMKGTAKNVISVLNAMGVDTTMAEYMLMKNTTTLAKKSEYGNFLRDTINAAKNSQDEERKAELYADAENIATDMKKLFGAKYVDGVIKSVARTEKKLRDAFEAMKDASYMTGQVSSKVYDEVEKYTGTKSDEVELSDEGLEKAGALKLTYGNQEFVLTPVQEAKYERLAKEWSADAYTRIIDGGADINAVMFGGKKLSDLTDKEKKQITNYYKAQVNAGQLTREEAQACIDEIKSGKRVGALNFAYYYKDLTIDEMTQAQKDATSDYYRNKVKSGEMTRDEALGCIAEIKAGTMTKRFKVYYPESYKDMTDEEKERILKKVETMSKDYAKEQMKTELVGE